MNELVNVFSNVYNDYAMNEFKKPTNQTTLKHVIERALPFFNPMILLKCYSNMLKLLFINVRLKNPNFVSEGQRCTETALTDLCMLI